MNQKACGTAKNIILLAGLPGCGKTTHLCQMCRDGWLIFDDFKADAHDGLPVFSKSRKFRTLLCALRDGLKCAVADIDFCKPEARAETMSTLLAEVPGIEAVWCFFENCFAACEANIIHRNRASLQEDLKKLREYSELYRIPQGALVLPVGHASNKPADL
jgi:hypothetical protein